MIMRRTLVHRPSIQDDAVADLRTTANEQDEIATCLFSACAVVQVSRSRPEAASIARSTGGCFPQIGRDGRAMLRDPGCERTLRSKATSTTTKSPGTATEAPFCNPFPDLCREIVNVEVSSSCSEATTNHEEAHRSVCDQLLQRTCRKNRIASRKSTHCHHWFIRRQDNGVCLHGTGDGKQVFRIALVSFKVTDEFCICA